MTGIDVQQVVPLTVPTCVVLRELLGQDRPYGLGISRRTGMGTGTVYAILWRLQTAGWVVTRTESREDPDYTADTGGPRKYYQLTPGGRELALAALAARPHLFGAPAGQEA